MVAPGSNNESAGKKDRREAAREKARIEREAEQKRRRRNRLFINGGIGIGVLAIAAIIALVVVNSGTTSTTAGPKNMVSDGILLSGSKMQAVETPAIKSGEKPVKTDTSKHTKTVNIVTYIDYQCPYCNQFETTNEAQLKTWVEQGVATLEIHPIAILDNSSLGTRYSTRAANAAACVANYQPNNYFAVNTALFANQPDENTTGLNDAKILSVLKGAGSDSAKIVSCVKNETFSPWVKAATTRATTKALPNTKTGKFNGTPTVLVNGEQYSGSLTDATVFESFVASVAQG
jgi:protein-disulfide isomerase